MNQDEKIELDKDYPNQYANGGGASITNITVFSLPKSERVIVYLCITAVALTYIIWR